MQTVLRVEDGKYVAGLGGSTKASQVFMNDGVTSVEDALSYSTTAKRVGTWVDGITPVYRKAYQLGAINPNGIAYLDASLKDKKPIAYGGYLTVGANRCVLPYVNVSATTYSCQVTINTTNGLTLIAGGNLTASDGYLWVDYI